MKPEAEFLPPNPAFLRLFKVYVKTYFLRHFTALRISDAHPLPALGPHTILYSNHPSWWDPIVMLLFAAGPLGGFNVYAPIDRESLARYPILRRLGLFGIETGTLSGARSFVDIGNRILADTDNMLVMTAQGRFADVRERPAGLRNGLARLLQSDHRRVAVPVALEYTHWNSRLPEALVAFGAPQRAQHGESVAATTSRLDAQLVGTLEALGSESILRDPERFTAIAGGRSTDVSGVYSVPAALRRAAERMRDRLRGSTATTGSRS